MAKMKDLAIEMAHDPILLDRMELDISTMQDMIFSFTSRINTLLMGGRISDETADEGVSEVAKVNASLINLYDWLTDQVMMKGDQ